MLSASTPIVTLHCCAMTGEELLGAEAIEERVSGQSDLLLFITDLNKALVKIKAWQK